MATFYRYTDSGAPTKPANANYNAASWFMSIVKACLVTGYGSKAGAGWTVVYEDTTTNARRLALSNGNGVVEFVTWGNTSMAVFIWDSITTPGTGRIYDTAWATAVSAGVNGWCGKNAKLPLASPASVIGINFQFMLSDAINSQWTITADSKSAWIDIHPALNSATAPKGSAVTTNTSYHSRLFFGALNTSDLLRSQFGNFFIMYDGQSSAASGSLTGATGATDKIIGLRTPLNIIPINNTEFISVRYVSNPTNNLLNIKDSIRIILPLLVVYLGADRPAPPGISTVYSNYAFATVPGIGSFAQPSGIDFWQYYSTQYAVSFNLEVFNINGIPWIPTTLQSSTSNSAVTDNSDWWTS